MHDENLSTEENKLLWRSRLHPDDSDRIIKSIDSCYSGAQIHGQMSFALRSDGTYGNFTNARDYKG
jgi:hypothetical protein